MQTTAATTEPRTETTKMEDKATVEGSGEIEDPGSGEVGAADGLIESVEDTSAAAADETGARRRRRRAAAGNEAKTADDASSDDPYTADDIQFIENPEDGSISVVVHNKEDGTGETRLLAVPSDCGHL